MMHAHGEYPAYRPISLAPEEMILCNQVCTRSTPWSISLGGTLCALYPAPLAAPFQAVCRIFVLLGTARWQVDVGSESVLRLHPALAGVDDVHSLPQPVREAVLEILVTPLLNALSVLAGMGTSLAGVLFPDASEALSGTNAGMAFLCSPQDADSSDIVNSIPVRICPPNVEAVRHVLPMLATLPARNSEAPASIAHVPGVPLTFSVLAGEMCLPLAAFRSLEPGDILLPDCYPARDHQLTLTHPLFGGKLSVVATLRGQNVSVTDLYSTRTAKEHAMSDSFSQPDAENTEQQNPEAPDQDTTTSSGSGSLDIDELQVTLTFELERRSIEMRDIMALAPGYTFMLDSDPLGPVTLRVNGKAVGIGRPVEVNGVLGVQITSLTS